LPERSALRPWGWAPGLPALLPERHSLRAITAGRLPVAATLPLVLTILVVPAARVVPADPAIILVARVGQADPAITPVAQAAPLVRVDPPITQVDPVVRLDPPITPAARADPVIIQVRPTHSVDRILTLAARGTGTPSVATSAGRLGAMGLAPGGRGHRHGRHGIDRSPRPVGAGTTARSTTGATRKRLSGIPVSTSGVSGSSECGSRCDR
jgi:hypothetical protein